jgi:predicted KAP-like P-loop ATPase
MMDAEDAMLALSEFVSTVVEVPKDRTKLIASVDTPPENVCNYLRVWASAVTGAMAFCW